MPDDHPERDAGCARHFPATWLCRDIADLRQRTYVRASLLQPRTALLRAPAAGLPHRCRDNPASTLLAHPAAREIPDPLSNRVPPDGQRRVRATGPAPDLQ